MRSFISIIGCVLLALWYAGCSESDTTAGIEIGNPEIASRNVGFTANFSIDYSETKKASLAKSASDDEYVVIDTFRLVLTEVLATCSYYNKSNGKRQDNGDYLGPENYLGPDRKNTAAVLPVSFADGAVYRDPFKNLDLSTHGILKEIKVSFQIIREGGFNSISGRVRVGDKKVPFVYELSHFQLFSLFYRNSQIDIQDSLVNLSVTFHVHRFIDGIDFASAEVGEDGVIHISENSNENVWKILNERFIPSFLSLQYEYTNDEGLTIKDYTSDVLNELNNVFYENIITNGNFKDGGQDWIFYTQFGGAADTAIIEEDKSNLMKVHVSEGGSESYSVQILHEDISVAKGAKYKFVFTIWSDIETEITARLGSYITYEKIGFEEHVPVTKMGRSFEVEFTAIVTDPFARLDLNLGKTKATFWIKDVQMIRIK